MAAPSLTYRALRALTGALVRLFFREVAVEGVRHVPAARGGLLVAWHPNGIVDPALILAQFPRRLVFGARDGLLRWPLLGALMRALGTVPIYRPQDAGAGDDEAARRAANAASLDALAAEVASGSFAALFPEGVSHDLPHVADVRSGAARLWGRASALARQAGAPPPALIPVGLHYEDKDRFRSRALVVFHPSLDVPDAAAVEADDAAAIDALTARIERALVTTAHATDDWELHHTMHRAASLVRAETARRAGVPVGEMTPGERVLGMAQMWTGYQSRRATHAPELAALREAVDAYERRLEALGLDDADLDRPPRIVRDPLLWALLVVQAVGVFLVLPLVVAVGYVVSGPPHLLLKVLARRYARAEKDAATVKLLGGLVLYPLAWTVAAVFAYVATDRAQAFVPWLPDAPGWAALAAFALSAVGALAALRYTEIARATLRALTVRLTRARRRTAVEQLRERRAVLHDRLVAMADGLDLPATLADRVG